MCGKAHEWEIGLRYLNRLPTLKYMIKICLNVGMDLFNWSTLEVPTQTVEGLNLLDHDSHGNGEIAFWNDYYTLNVSIYVACFHLRSRSKSISRSMQLRIFYHTVLCSITQSSLLAPAPFKDKKVRPIFHKMTFGDCPQRQVHKATHRVVSGILLQTDYRYFMCYGETLNQALTSRQRRRTQNRNSQRIYRQRRIDERKKFEDRAISAEKTSERVNSELEELKAEVLGLKDQVEQLEAENLSLRSSISSMPWRRPQGGWRRMPSLVPPTSY